MANVVDLAFAILKLLFVTDFINLKFNGINLPNFD